MFKPFPSDACFFMTLGKRTFENLMGKRENAGNQHFLLFPQGFLSNQRHKPTILVHLNCHLHTLFIWSCPKICRLGKS